MAATPVQKLAVFIADDSASIRGSLSSYLLSHTPEIEIVGFAATAPEAIENIRALKPDVVILDIRMPGGSGIGVLTAIKADQRNVFVMMFTNETMQHVRNKCLALGADRFFDKSTEFEKLHVVLDELVRDRGLKQELEPLAASI